MRCLGLHYGYLALLYGGFSVIGCRICREFIGRQPCLLDLLLLHRFARHSIRHGFSEAERALYQLARPKVARKTCRGLICDLYARGQSRWLLNGFVKSVLGHSSEAGATPSLLDGSKLRALQVPTDTACETLEPGILSFS